MTVESSALLVRLLPMLDDIAGLEQNVLENRSPLRRLAEQEFEIHPKVLELFLLRIAHDGARRFVLLDRDALLVPADRLRLFGEWSNHASKRSCRGGKLVRRLVILVESHRCPLFV